MTANERRLFLQMAEFVRWSMSNAAWMFERNPLPDFEATLQRVKDEVVETGAAVADQPKERNDDNQR